MNNPASSDLGKRCASLAEDLEADHELIESAAMIDDREKDADKLHTVLENRYTVDERGTVREVEAIVTTGGPHIVVECLSGVVAGSWGGDTHRCHVDSEQVKQYGTHLAERMEARIDQ